MTQFAPYAIAMLILALIVGTLAVARVTRLLVDDQLMNWYRLWVDNRWGATSWRSYLVHCPWCTSVWVALPIMPVAALWPSIWVIAALSIPAASMVSGLLLDK